MVKKYGNKLLEMKPKLQTKLDDTSKWFEKRPYFYLTFYRLMYGFGTAILMLSSLKGTSYARFAIHSFISIFLWVSLLGGFGFFCAEMMIENLNFMSSHSPQVIGTLAILGLLYWFFVKRLRDNHAFKPKES